MQLAHCRGPLSALRAVPCSRYPTPAPASAPRSSSRSHALGNGPCAWRGLSYRPVIDCSIRESGANRDHLSSAHLLPSSPPCLFFLFFRVAISSVPLSRRIMRILFAARIRWDRGCSKIFLLKFHINKLSILYPATVESSSRDRTTRVSLVNQIGILRSSRVVLFTSRVALLHSIKEMNRSNSRDARRIHPKQVIHPRKKTHHR